jgi:hypothetical protein
MTSEDMNTNQDWQSFVTLGVPGEIRWLKFVHMQISPFLAVAVRSRWTGHFNGE